MSIEFSSTPSAYTASVGYDRQWELIYCTLAGTALADISMAEERTLLLKLNRPGTITLSLNLFHAAVAEVVANPHGLIAAYKRKRLVDVFEVTSIQASGTGDQRALKIVGQQPGYTRLMKRFIGQSIDGVTYTNMDRGAIAAQIIATENSRNSTGIALGTVQPSSKATAGPWYVKQALEAINELATPLNGFDYWFEPNDPTSGTHSYFNAAPVRGRARENATFEYGQGRANLREYAWLLETNNRISRAISLPQSYPDNLSVDLLFASDSATQTAISLREDIVEGELIDDAFRQALVDEHVAIRKSPRTIYTFNPAFDDFTGRVPAFPFDYNLGDIVRGVVNDNGVLVLDGQVRVYGVEIDIDRQGSETVTLTLVDEE